MHAKKMFVSQPRKSRIRIGEELKKMLIFIAEHQLEAYQDYMAPPLPFTSTDEITERKRLKKKIAALERAKYIKIEKRRKGERAALVLTKKGRATVNEVQLYMPKQGEWDGSFCVIMYDIPEPARGLRDTFRKFLKNAGFIQTQKSIWISPANVRDQLLRFIEDIGAVEWVTCFTTKDLQPSKELKRVLKRYIC